MRSTLAAVALGALFFAGCTSDTEAPIDAALDDASAAIGSVGGSAASSAPESTEFKDCTDAGIALGRQLADVINGADEQTLTDGFGAEGLREIESRDPILDAAEELGCDPEDFAVGFNDYLLVRLAVREAEPGADGRERLRAEVLDALMAVQEARGGAAGGNDETP